MFTKSDKILNWIMPHMNAFLILLANTQYIYVVTYTNSQSNNCNSYTHSYPHIQSNNCSLGLTSSKSKTYIKVFLKCIQLHC